MDYTSRALQGLAGIGGPRCCKRDAYVSIETAIDYIAQRYQVQLDKDSIRCSFYPQNGQRLKERCPYYPLQ